MDSEWYAVRKRRIAYPETALFIYIRHIGSSSCRRKLRVYSSQVGLLLELIWNVISKMGGHKQASHCRDIQSAFASARVKFRASASNFIDLLSYSVIIIASLLKLPSSLSLSQIWIAQLYCESLQIVVSKWLFSQKLSCIYMM